jgi:transcription initiation factor IIE alpha subunit
MAKVIGFDPKSLKQFTCYDCAAIVEYSKFEEQYQYSDSGQKLTDEGTHIMGLQCPNCYEFNRTNP